MPNFIENYGLEIITRNEETTLKLLSYVAQNGKGIVGYYDLPYFFKVLGRVEIWLRTERSDDGKLQVFGFNTHCSGRCVWEMASTGIDISPKNRLPMERLIVFNKPNDNTGTLPINIINADILPSFLEDDIVKMQIVALPTEINYYADEEEYTAAQKEDKDGKKWLIANGSLIPAGFLHNYSPNIPKEDKDHLLDGQILFTATVKELYHGEFELNGEKENTFIRGIVDTQYGELEFNHTYKQVPEELRKNIREGAVISGACILSGDVAIYEYENGFIKDYKHDLQLLRYVLKKGEAERLRQVLSSESEYESDNSEKIYYGAEEIIQHLEYVHNNHEGEYYAHFATIVEIEGGSEAEYPVGTQCIVLANDSKDNFESIVFISVDEKGIISKIRVTTDSKYHFRIEK